MIIIKLLKGLFQRFTQESKKSTKNQKHLPSIIPRAAHSISRQAINPNALKVLYRLHNANFDAFLVGGCVRDLLLGQQPKDFDIATNARPEEVRKLFKNCRLIGKRFRLAHIVFGREIIEVATFRTHHENAGDQHARMHQGMIVRDNVYGPIEDDACRRDFSVNALYYNIADFSIVDYTQGMQDIQARMLRMIGDPELRFREDPVRLLRAARFMGKLKLAIEPGTEKPMVELSLLLQQVSSARLFQEVLKYFAEGALLDTFRILRKYQLFEQLFPQTAAVLHKPTVEKLIEQSLSDTDKRLELKKTVSPAFLFAVFLWHSVQEEAANTVEEDIPSYVTFEKAIHVVIKNQTVQLAIPRLMQTSIRDICFLQHRFTHRYGARPYRVLEHPRFRAAYDLLLLRTETQDADKDLYDWWTLFYEATTPEAREELIKQVNKQRGRGRKKSRSKLPKKPPVIKPAQTE